MLENLREVDNIVEVGSALRECKGKTMPFILWNNQTDGRQKVDSFIDEIVIKGKRIVLLLSLNDKCILTTGDNVYLFQESMKMLFMGIVLSKKAGKVKIKLSPKFFLEEKRTITRFEFQKMEVNATIVKVNKDNENPKKEKVNLKDVSEFGFGFTISPHKAETFFIDEEIGIVAIDKLKLPSPILGTIVHKSPIKSEDMQISKIKIGVCFKVVSKMLSEVMKEFNAYKNSIED